MRDYLQINFPIAIILLLAGILVSLPSVSKSDDNKWTVTGPGTMSCGSYLEYRQNDRSMRYHVAVFWVQGFLDGINHERASVDFEQFEGQKAPALFAYFDKYCKENPLENIARGAEELALELQQSISE